MATTASIELSPAMTTALKRRRTRLRNRFEPIEGNDRPVCDICGPPKTAVFRDSRRLHNLCGKCAAQRWEICWARHVDEVVHERA